MGDIRPLTYRPIGPDSIRLFQINKHTKGVISGRLEVFDLSQLPAYHNLGYCWSIQENTIPVEIDGEILCVSPNLGDGLKRLQDVAEENDKTFQSISWLWIDQLCINERDVKERSEQVQLMGSIYKRSVRTLIWLGNGSVSSSNAWLLIDQIYAVFKRENPKAQTLADIPLKVYSDSEFAVSGLPDWAHPPWEELRNLLRIPWFTRIWVIQEVALSPQDWIILHDQNQYPWERISWAAPWLRRNGHLRLAGIPNQLLNVDAMSCIRRSQSPWDLDALLCIQMLKCWYGSLKDWRFWHPKLESLIPHLPHRAEPSYKPQPTNFKQDY
ncbi:heterokaryon incompatibility protein-domain-containing protein [Xylaria digitata]|nr:heterokaryon incompatibility protein-domain-containing protein [Xylaria digitata]